MHRPEQRVRHVGGEGWAVAPGDLSQFIRRSDACGAGYDPARDVDTAQLHLLDLGGHGGECAADLFPFAGLGAQSVGGYRDLVSAGLGARSTPRAGRRRGSGAEFRACCTRL